MNFHDDSSHKSGESFNWFGIWHLVYKYDLMFIPISYNIWIGNNVSNDEGVNELHTKYCSEIFKENYNYNSFKMFMNFGKQIVERVKWKKYSKQCLINIFVTVSDEALTLLALHNSEFVWEDQYSKHATIPAPKYTCHRAHRRVKDGLSYEGRNRFNDYFDLVRENRMTKRRENLKYYIFQKHHILHVHQ